jgi:hypothetical protein
MAEMIVGLGWQTPPRVTSRDPWMRRHDRYGPYMISSGLPLHYYEPGEGLLDMWYQPVQWWSIPRPGRPSPSASATTEQRRARRRTAARR